MMADPLGTGCPLPRQEPGAKTLSGGTAEAADPYFGARSGATWLAPALPAVAGAFTSRAPPRDSI